MDNIVVKNFLLSFAWIKSSGAKPHYYEVVLSLKKSENSSNCFYVAFPFYSFDLMYVYLKSLARTCKVCSIDNLKNINFPVKIEYYSNYNSPNIFKALYIDYKTNTTWPASQKIKGYFLLDS